MNATLHAEFLALSHAFYCRLDQRRYEEVAALFAPDGQWVRGGKPCAGRTQIISALQARPDDLITRHLVTNLVIEHAEAAEAEIVLYITALVGRLPASGPADAPQPVQSLSWLESRDRLVRHGNDWCVAHKEAKPVFTGQPAGTA